MLKITMRARLDTNPGPSRDASGRFVAKAPRLGSGKTKLERGVKQYKIESIAHAAGVIRKTARRSIRYRRGRNYSRPGRPPKTKTGLFRKSIVYWVDRGADQAVIGPTANLVDDLGAVHELGGERGRRGRKAKYPPRPTMGPAFDKILPRLPESWRRKIKPGG